MDNIELTRQLEELTKALEESIRTKGAEHADSIRIKEQLESYRTVVSVLTGESHTLTGKLQGLSRNASILAANYDKLSEAERKELMSLTGLIQAQQSLISVSKTFGTALFDSSKGLSKYDSTLTAIGDGAVKVGSNFGEMGLALGKATQYLTAFAGAALKQVDGMVKAYDDLADTGATIGITSTQLREMGIDARLSTENLGKLTSSAKSLNQGLVALGGSASEGVKAFGGILHSTEEQLRGYKRLGLSQDDVIEMQTKFVNQITQVGGQLGKTPKQLNEESKNYIESLQTLAEITGVSAKKQQEALDIAIANENFNAHLSQLESDRAAALESGNKAEADRIQNVIDAKKEFAGMAVATQSAAGAARLLEAVSSKQGVVYTENTSKLLLNGIGIEKMAANLNSGTKQTTEMLAETANASKRFKNQFGELATGYGAASRELQQTFGIDNAARKTEATYRTMSAMSEKDRAEFIKKTISAQQDKKEGKGPTDLPVSTATWEESITRTLKIFGDETLNLFNPLTSSSAGTAVALGALMAAATVLAGKFALMASGKLTGGAEKAIGDLLSKYNTKPPTSGPGASSSSAVTKPLTFPAINPNALPPVPGAPTVPPTTPVASKVPSAEVPAALRKAAGAPPLTLEQVRQQSAPTTPKPVSATTSAAATAASAGMEEAVEKGAESASKMSKALGVLNKMAGPLSALVTVGVSAYDTNKSLDEIAAAKKAGTLTDKEVDVQRSGAIGKGTGTAIGGISGGWAGAAAGSSAGAAIGALGGPIGIGIGAALGGILGATGGSMLGGWVGGKAGKVTGEVVGEATTDKKDPKDIKGAVAETEAEKIAQKQLTNDDSMLKVLESIEKLNKVSNNSLSNIDDMFVDLMLLKTLPNAEMSAFDKNAKLKDMANKYSSSSSGGRASSSGSSSGAGSSRPVTPEPAPSAGGGRGAMARTGFESSGIAIAKEEAGVDVATGPKKLLDYIGKLESNGEYTKLVGGKNEPRLTEMTIKEVLAYQKDMLNNGFASSAIGKYQIITKTLQGLLEKGVARETDVFNAETQDKLATALLKGRGYDKFVSGKLDQETFANNLAKEWASLPTSSGKSHYEGVGNNKSLTSRDSLTEMLASYPQAKSGGILSGPNTGYPVTLHGHEAVLPLDPNSVITKLLKTPETEIKQQMAPPTPAPQIAGLPEHNTEVIEELMKMLASKLEIVIDTLASSKDTQEELLRYSRV